MGRKSKIERVARTSPDLAEEHMAQLKGIFPECVTEGRVDFDKLKATLGEEIDSRPERYSFSWAGKRDAVRILQTPTPATLIPDQKESVDFEKTKNIFIEGDNLEVLKLLYKSYFGRVKMIYIDPPYNTGNALDFIYPDNYADPLDTYLKLTGQKTNDGTIVTSNPETSGRHHSAWLTMMYPRLFMARQLLQEDGIVFVSIDDNEICNLRMIMNEIFGEENFIDNIIWKKRYGGGAKEKYLVSLHEYVICYARNKEALGPLFIGTDQETIDKYYKLKDDKYEIRGPYRTHPLEATKSMGARKNLVFPVPGPDGVNIMPKRQWLWSEERVTQALKNDELEFIRDRDGKWGVHTKQYLKDDKGEIRRSKLFSIIEDVYSQHGTNEILDIFGDAHVFPFPKPTGLLDTLIDIATDSKADELILDFFAGSSTTAHATFALNREDNGNRRYIMVQLPEPTGREDFKTISDIGKERIRRVIKKLKSGKQGRLDLKERTEPEDLGFRVFKLAASNYKHWKGVEQHDATALEKQMEAFTDPLVEKWKTENVIWEVAIKEGFSLSSQIEKVAGIKSNTIHRVNDLEQEQHFRICLDDNIKPETVKALGLKKNELFVCRDVALGDEMAANLALQCRLKTI